MILHTISSRHLGCAKLWLLLLLGVLPLQARAAEVWTMDLSGPITPAAADYFIHTLDRAQDAGAAVLVVQLDTPGGLDSSMRDINREILGSRIPVVMFVAPNGARAASAGTYLLYASHIAAMAPATNVGSSTPVTIPSPFPTPVAPERAPPRPDDSQDEPRSTSGAQSTMERKLVNDAVAYIRSLAALRERNAEWAERTVREAANLTAKEALEQNVIDVIAEDIDSLLDALDGRTVRIDGATIHLDVGTAEIVRIEPGWRYEFLALITEPNVAYILLMLGIYGLLLEFYNPGFGVPGVTGIICLLLAAYALQMLPINYSGLALILVGIVLMVAEVITPSVGVMGVGGAIAFIAGSVLLLDSDLPGYRVSIPIIVAFAVASLGIVAFGAGAALRVRHMHPSIGREAMVGAAAVALEDFTERGLVRAFGETWQAESKSPVRKGDRLRILAVDGLLLNVEREG